MLSSRIAVWACLSALALAPGCSSSSSGSSAPDAQAPTGVTVMFDASADFTSPDHFFDFPWPSDLRLSASGTPVLAGVPNPTSSGVLNGLRGAAEQRAGFPVVPVAYNLCFAKVPLLYFAQSRISRFLLSCATRTICFTCLIFSLVYSMCILAFPNLSPALGAV